MRRKIDDPHELLLALMRADFAVFLRKAFAWITGGDPIMWNWHLDATTHALDRVRNGESRRLLITMPPRNGKSIMASVAWVAWMLGINPRHRFVCVSYSNDLSIALARQCLAILEAPWYRELFPGTILTRTAWHDIETTAGGGRLATSITGTLTGRGGDTIVLDDLIKPQEADSETIRANVNAWYQSTLTSRLNDKRKGAIICVMQRLHEYDVAGLMIESGRYDVLSLPAIADRDQIVPLPRGEFYHFRAGEVLHPAREDRKVLEDIRAEMGSERFAGQFLQNPVPARGNLIKTIWLKTYDPATVRQGGGIIVQSVDPANKANPNCDFSVIVTALVQGKYVYILDVTRARLEFPELRAKVVELAEEYRPHVLLIEDKASGEGLISEFRTPDYPTVPGPIARKAVTDKVSRVDGVTGMIEAGQLLLPPNAPWLSEFKAELLAFPSGRFDDQVDAIAHLLEWVRERHSLPVSMTVGPELMEVGGYVDDDDDDFGLSAWL